MAEFVKKTMMGYYKEVPGGESDPECTHVILTKKEYGQLLKEKAQAEQESRDTRYDADRAIQKARNEAQRQVQQIDAEAQQRELDMEQELAMAQQEAEYQRGLNANLLRISRERANADRKLKPKKEHTGYFVVVTNEKDYRFKISRSQWRQVRLWETMLQSPYSVDFTEEQARKQIREDLFGENEGSSWLINGLGIALTYHKRYEDLIDLKDWETKYKNQNIALKLELKLRANFRAGYWEASFLHTKPLGVVPPGMRVQ